jgi:hypothetical protein
MRDAARKVAWAPAVAVAAAALLAVLAAAATTTAGAAVFAADLGDLQRNIQSGAICATVTQGCFIVVRYDDSGLVSYRVAAAKHRPSRLPRVFLLGGSAVRECATTDAAMQQSIVQRWGGRVKVVSLASSVQRVAGTLAAIDNLPSDVGGVVVIGVHEITFASTVAETKAQLTGVPLLMTSRALHDLVRARLGYNPPNNMLTGLRRDLDWYQRIRHVPAFEAKRPVAWQRHRYDSMGVMSLAAKQALMTQFKYNRGAWPSGPFFRSFDLNRALLRRCVTLAKAKGYQVLLMEDPKDRVVVGHAYDLYKQWYEPVCRRFVSELGAHYVDINDQAGLVDRDFRDICHLLRSGRDKWTPRLVTAIVRILRDHPPVYLDSVTAAVSDPAPVVASGSTETVTGLVKDTAGRPLKGARVTFTWRFASGDAAATATTDATGAAMSTADVSGLSPGVGVVVDVSVTWKGLTATASVTFTPAAPEPTPTAVSVSPTP